MAMTDYIQSEINNEKVQIVSKNKCEDPDMLLRKEFCELLATIIDDAEKGNINPSLIKMKINIKQPKADGKRSRVYKWKGKNRL